MVRIGALFGFLGVASGAFGAHFLRETLANNGTTAIWQTAVFYQLIHTLALLWLATWKESPLRWGIAICWIAGIIVFSGSLYLLAYTGQRWLGAITPWGGTSFLLGWIFLLLPRFRK